MREARFTFHVSRFTPPATRKGIPPSPGYELLVTRYNASPMANKTLNQRLSRAAPASAWFMVGPSVAV
jgi:hypothetical protein